MHRDNVLSDFPHAIRAQLSLGFIIHYHKKCLKRAREYFGVFEKRTIAEERRASDSSFYVSG